MSLSSKTAIGGKALAPVVDIFPQISLGYHDESRVDEEMRLLRSLGFERVYFVLCNPGYPMFSNPALCLQPPDIAGLQNFSFHSLVALGDPNLAYVRKCQEHGMEAFAILKPYESGGGATVPLGARMAWNPPRLADIGGDRIGFDNLLTRRPGLRVSRKPMPDYDRLMEQPVTSISASFFLPDHIGLKSEGRSDDIDLSGISMRLFLSEDNGTYIPYDGLLDVRATFGPVEIRDPNGFSVFASPREGWTFHLEGFSFPPRIRYFALVLETEGKLYTIPQSMVSLHGAAGHLPSTCSTHIRSGAVEDASTLGSEEKVWGMEGLPSEAKSPREAESRLCEWGFEFEWHGAGFWGPGWSGSCAVGIARGKLQWMKGTPCEAYPEVCEYWLDQVRYCIQLGFDGVDFRLQNHSGMVSDYVHYGYNPPLVAAYKERHGVDILVDEADPLKIMEIRGDFFTEFVEEAAALLHAAGRKVQIHLRKCHEEPRLSTEFNELGFWAMPKIWLARWRHLIDLADEVTLKDYHFNSYDPGAAAEIKKYASASGKRVWVHCYISQGREMNLDFFKSIEADALVGGVLLYEVSHAEKGDVNFGLIEQCGPVGFYEPNVKALRHIMTELGFGPGTGLEKAPPSRPVHRPAESRKECLF